MCPPTRCYARPPRPCGEGALAERRPPHRADRGSTLGGCLQPVARGVERHNVHHVVLPGPRRHLPGRRLRAGGSEQLHARMDRGSLHRALACRRQGRDRRGAAGAPERGRLAGAGGRAPARAPRRAPGPRTGQRSAAAGGPCRRDEPEVHLRLVRDRLVQPLRARGRARRRRGAGAGLQPALHLREHRARQDAPAAGDLELRARARQRHDDALRDERDLHERLHQLAPRQAHRRLQGSATAPTTCC